MEGEISISKEIADTLVKICFDTMKFSALYEQDGPHSAKRLFQCNDELQSGLGWMMGAGNLQTLTQHVSACQQAVATALNVYAHLQIQIDNKEEIIHSLVSLQAHLDELRQQLDIRF